MKLPEELKKDQIIVLMKFGSHLYGTDGPNSDEDYVGVFMPTERQILLNQVPKSYRRVPKKEGEGIRNKPGDVDVEVYSIQYFLKLAMEGQTVAIDMLHAPLEWCEITSPIWKDLHERRVQFHTKNLKAFVGYARKQAAKYGIKGSRLNDAKQVLNVLKANVTYGDVLRMNHIWHLLPQGEHIHFIEDVTPRMYQVCGKQIQETVTVNYAYDIVKKFYDEYGNRAKKAARNEGIDWKAVSHAMRAAYQLVEIYTTGDIRFPLQDALYLKKIKDGEIPWVTVQNDLEVLMDEVELRAESSHYPETIDRKYWESWLFNTIKEAIK